MEDAVRPAEGEGAPGCWGAGEDSRDRDGRALSPMFPLLLREATLLSLHPGGQVHTAAPFHRRETTVGE